MGEKIVTGFRVAYARKEQEAGHRIPLTVACKEIGMAYSTLNRYVNGKVRVIDLDVFEKIMTWLGTTDFNDMFERREVDDAKPTD